MADLFGVYKGIRSALPKDQPIAKAYILIKKGGRFSENNESGSIDDMLSQLDMDGAEMAELKSEIDSVMKSMGVSGPFSGFSDNERIFVQLNPNSYTISAKTNFKSENMGGLKNNEKGFNTYPPPEPRTLKVTFYYDSSIQEGLLNKLDDSEDEIKNVLSTDSGLDAGIGAVSLYKKFTGAEDLNKLYLDKISSLTRNLEETHTPPLISFNYGSMSFVGYTKDVSISYKKFNFIGEVTRAEVTMTIEESKDDSGNDNKSSTDLSLSGGSSVTVKNKAAPSIV